MYKVYLKRDHARYRLTMTVKVENKGYGGAHAQGVVVVVGPVMLPPFRPKLFGCYRGANGSGDRRQMLMDYEV